MTILSLAQLLVRTTKEAVLRTAFAIATSVGVPVTSWQPGDPTRSLYLLESEFLADTLEPLVHGFIGSGFLDSSEGTWLEINADQTFGVDVPQATQATVDVTLTNTGGAVYDETDLAVGAVVVKNSTTGKTYTNTTTGTLASGPGTEVTLSFVADEPGSDSSSAAGEIDELVTTLLGVTVSNAAAAIGTDKPDDPTIRQLCRDKRSSLSPNGPRDAYRYVAMTPSLTGTTAISGVRVYSDSDACDVTVYLRSPSGAVSSADRALVETALITWALPLGISLFVYSATAVTVPVTYALYVYKRCNLTAAEIAELVEEALEDLFKSLPIGGDALVVNGQGYLYKSLIESTIRGVLPDDAFRVVVSLPTGDTALAANEVPTLGAITPTITLVPNP